MSRWRRDRGRGPIAARIARLEVRFAEVTLKPPQDKSQYGPLKLWAVLAQETDAPEGIPPLCWMLLTTCRVCTFEDAIEKLAWYTKRWSIMEVTTLDRRDFDCICATICTYVS